MKWINILTFLVLSITSVYAQPKDPKEVPLSWKVNNQNPKIGDVIDIIITGNIPSGQHVYSNGFICDPQKYELQITKDQSFELVGKPKSIGDIEKYDDVFECKIREFEKKVEIKQQIKVLKSNLNINGKLSYQTCTESSCLSFTHTFSKLGVKAQVSIVDSVSNPTAVPDTAIPVKEDIEKPSETPNATNPKKPEPVKETNLWLLFLAGFLGAIPALLTPCVFPMLPMTVAYFTKQNDKAKGRKLALFYGFSIVLIFVILGLIFASIFDESFGNTLSTHWLPNMIFFAIFIIFGASFLGMFEIVLPSSFVNKIDQKGTKGGYIGVFFIAFTLVLVSFSCTAPIVGSVAILASGGEFLRPLFALLGFGIMIALPFTLFAFFPQWLNSLPKSGGWLNTVKVVLGIIEIALAFKFLSQADLVYHWRILDRDIFLAMWIVLAFVLGFYLLGKIRFPHDSMLDRVPVPQFFLAFLALSFGVYMIPGLVGAPLRPLSGILPPLHTQNFVINASHKENKTNAMFSDILEMPHGLSGYFYLPEAIEASKREKKPIFVDFTGHGCTNCRRMEEYVWVKPNILKLLKEQFIVVSLYVDERSELPQDKWVKSQNDGSMLKTLGQINSELQSKTFGSNAQPYYYIIDSEMNVLNTFNGYIPDDKKMETFLIEGAKAF